MISFIRASFTTTRLALKRTELVTAPATFQCTVNLLPFSCTLASSCSCNDPWVELLRFNGWPVIFQRLSKLLYSFLFICQSPTGITAIGWLVAISVTLRWACGTFESYDFVLNFQFTVQGWIYNRWGRLPSNQDWSSRNGMSKEKSCRGYWVPYLGRENRGWST